eukprot:s146_g1.t1
MVRSCLIWALLLPLEGARRLQDAEQFLPNAFSRQFPRLIKQARPRLINQARRHASNGNANARAFEELIVDLGIYSKEGARQLMEQASKGPNTRFYEAVRHAYRPSAKQVADILATHGRGPKGRRLTDSIQRSFTGQGFVEQVTRRAHGMSQADLLLSKVQARVPMIEAGIPVARIWKTPIPQHLKQLVQEAVQEAFLAGKYGTGDAAQKIMTESAKVIARTAAAGVFIGLGAGVHNDMADILEDGDHGDQGAPEPDGNEDGPVAPVTEKAEALATLSEEPSVEHAKDVAEALGLSAQEVLATTLQYFMGHSVEAGTFTETHGSGDSFLWQLHDNVLALSDEELAKATTEIDAVLRNAQSAWVNALFVPARCWSGLIETREGLNAISEAEAQGGLEDWKNIRLETEDLSKMEELE